MMKTINLLVLLFTLSSFARTSLASELDTMPSFICGKAIGSEEVDDVTINPSHDRAGRQAYQLISQKPGIFHFMSGDKFTVVNNENLFEIHFSSSLFIDNPFRKVEQTLSINKATGEGSVTEQIKSHPFASEITHNIFSLQGCNKIKE
jgi:hypothetical protein